MSLLSGIFKRKRLLVVGLDGTPYTLLQKLISQGYMPNLKSLISEGNFRQVRSVIPTISSVAWSNFMSGKNPAKHGIFGFVDFRPSSYEVYIPDGRYFQGDRLWDIISKAGKTVIVMGVPVTFPPKPVKGFLVCGFLAPRLEKATYPPELAEELKKLGYRIDADPQLARQNKDKFLEAVFLTLEKRWEAFSLLLKKKKWDFAMVHFMSTDRLHHFLWRQVEEGDEKFKKAFLDFYKKIDLIIGEVSSLSDRKTPLILLSDHGFCSVKHEVSVYWWLKERGWLEFSTPEPKKPEDIAPSRTRVLGLIPGRFYVNLEDRFPGGIVPQSEYRKTCESFVSEIMELKDPETGESILEKAVLKEEIYSGPLVDRSADIIAVPKRGYDLKGGIGSKELFTSSALTGMHTYDDAFVLLSDRDIQRDDPEITDVMPTCLDLLDVEKPPELDGRSLL